MTETERTPWQVAHDIARETGWNLETERTERGWGSVGIGPVGQHRDSDALNRSNFTVIYQDLSECFGDRVDIFRFGHWAVGWIEEIGFDTSRPEILQAVTEWRSALYDYPVASDDHYSELEWEETAKYVEEETRSILFSSDLLPLTDEGEEDLVSLVLSAVTEQSSCIDGIGDITEAVTDCYCYLLAAEWKMPPEQTQLV